MIGKEIKTVLFEYIKIYLFLEEMLISLLTLKLYIQLEEFWFCTISIDKGKDL